MKNGKIPQSDFIKLSTRARNILEGSLLPLFAKPKTMRVIKQAEDWNKKNYAEANKLWDEKKYREWSILEKKARKNQCPYKIMIRWEDLRNIPFPVIKVRNCGRGTIKEIVDFIRNNN